MPDKTKTTPPLLQKVDRLPPATRQKREPIYQDIIRQIITEGNEGTYKVNIPNKKANAIYTSLTRQIKQWSISGVTLHRRKNSVYIVIGKRIGTKPDLFP